VRGTVPGLATPYRLVDLLPAVYREEDPFIGRFTAGLDDVLAPIVATLDCLEAYVDPLLTPDDLLDWLAGWVGAELDEHAPVQARRLGVAAAARLHRQRGTVTGLRGALEVLTGGPVEVVDSGGVTWSQQPDQPAPGSPHPSVTVRLPGGSPVPSRAIDALVRSAKPAHVRHVIEIAALETSEVTDP